MSDSYRYRGRATFGIDLGLRREAKPRRRRREYMCIVIAITFAEIVGGDADFVPGLLTAMRQFELKSPAWGRRKLLVSNYVNHGKAVFALARTPVRLRSDKRYRCYPGWSKDLTEVKAGETELFLSCKLSNVFSG
jgi:hypothetical protein